MSYNYPIFNPMYQNPTPQQMFNPMYQPQIQQPPQMQQPSIPQQQNVNLPGKVVESVDVMRTMDIPMDGNTYYFPKADGSEIYTKRWLQNGTTEQVVFKVQKAEVEDKPDPLLEKLNGIEEHINKLEEILNKQPKAVSKKES